LKTEKVCLLRWERKLYPLGAVTGIKEKETIERGLENRIALSVEKAAQKP